MFVYNSGISEGAQIAPDGRTVYVNAAKIASVNRCAGSNTVCSTRADCRGAICAPSDISRLYCFLHND